MLAPQFVKMVPCRLATSQRQQGSQFAFDEFPVEIGTLAHDNTLHIGPVAIAIREHFHHDQVFGATSQQADAAAKVKRRGSIYTSKLKIDGAKGNINWRAVRCLGEKHP